MIWIAIAIVACVVVIGVHSMNVVSSSADAANDIADEAQHWWKEQRH